MNRPTILTRAQVREVDRRAIEEMGIPGVVLMENAGRAAAEVVLEALRACAGSRVLVIGGPGNNGGDGWVIARHLHNTGVSVTMCLVGTADRLSRDGGINFRIVRKMGLPLICVESAEDVQRLRRPLDETDVIVDALLGTGFRGSVRSPIDAIIRRINARRDATVVSIDVPSGLDCDTGEPAYPTVRADVTVTFVAAKAGFEAAAAKAVLGRVVVADIGAPPELVEEAAGQA